MDKPDKMRRDYIYTVVGLPTKLGEQISGTIFFTHTIQQNQPTGSKIRQLLKRIAKAAGPAAVLLPPLENEDPSLGWIGIRTIIEEEKAAFKDSHKRLQGLVDTYAAITGKAMDVMPIVIVREGQNGDGKVRYFGWWGYGKIPRAGTTDRDAARTKKLYEIFAPIMGQLARGDSFETELREQIAWGTKMYRYSQEPGEYGPRFLLRFAAVEALILGKNEGPKGKLLEDRIGRLCSEIHEIKPLVLKMWKLRCDGSHNARAFSLEAGTSNLYLETIFIRALLFAVAEADKAKTIRELWANQGNYKSPAEFVATPSDPITGAIELASGWLPITVKVGNYLDGIYQEIQRRIAQI